MSEAILFGDLSGTAGDTKKLGGLSAQSVISRIETLEAVDVELYVDCNSTEDTENGTEGAPFKSVQKAVDSVPANAKRAIINVAEGTYAENVEVRDTCRNFTIAGAGAGKTFISTIYAVNIPVFTMQGITFNGYNEALNSAVCISRSGSAHIESIELAPPEDYHSKSGMYCGIRIFNSTVFMLAATVNKFVYAIQAEQGAFVTCRSVKGSTNRYAFSAQMATIYASDYSSLSYTGSQTVKTGGYIGLVS